jgi:hypothetical protein
VTVVLLTLGWVHDSLYCLCAGLLLSPLGRLLAAALRSVPHGTQRDVVAKFTAVAAMIAVVVTVSAVAAWSNADGPAFSLLDADLATRVCVMTGIAGAAASLLGRPGAWHSRPLLVVGSSTATLPFAVAGAILGTEGIDAAQRFFESHAGLSVVLISLGAMLADACIRSFARTSTPR